MSATSLSRAELRGARLRLRLRNMRALGAAFARRTDGVVGALILAFFATLALAPEVFVGPLQTVTTATAEAMARPAPSHLLGADRFGRDMLNLTVHGTRVSMVIGLLATIITIALGALVGIASGYIGGRTDAFLMRITDFFLVIPTFVLAIILAPITIEVIGPGAELFGIRATLLVIVAVIGLTAWASTARIIRSQTLSIKERMFVDRARVIGGGGRHIMWRHIFPNVVNLIVANTVLTFAGAVFTETTLSFIGLGDPFQPSWGQLLNSAQVTGAPGLGAWWMIVPPATCVVAVILSFTLVGNALDDVLNPKSAIRR